MNMRNKSNGKSTLHRTLALGITTTVLLTGMSGEGLADSPPPGLYKCYYYSVQAGWGGVSANYALEFTLLDGEKFESYGTVSNYSYDPVTRSLDFGDGDSAKYMGLNSSGYTLKVRTRYGGELACHRRT
jgi:hypothetical protein